MNQVPSALLRTPLYDWHAAHNGRLVEFGGWEMPVQYSSIVEEHQAVRQSAGLFDISHMGRLTCSGLDAESLLSHLLTCRVDNLVDGQIRYGLICNDGGGIRDDVLVNRLNAMNFGLVVNASNRLKIVERIQTCVLEIDPPNRARDLEFDDQTTETAMIAIQGPQAVSILSRLTTCDGELKSLKYYTGCPGQVAGCEAFISRTGYTGEDGFEIIVAQDAPGTISLWQRLLDEGRGEGLIPCGLGCRDTLRLEAAMPLYGHELSEIIDPLTAGLSFAVKLDKPSFIGRESLLTKKAVGPQQVRVGLQLTSKRIAREHTEVYVGSRHVGDVSSGTYSPTLQKSIAMAYVDRAYSSAGTSVDVDIRGKRESAIVVALPFYKRP